VNLLEAVFLGILQGLTEFLPISSTAHLTIAGKILGLVSEQNPEAWTAFIAVMQLGTMAAVLLYFRRDILGMIVAVFSDIGRRIRGDWSASPPPDARLAWLIILGTLPVGFIGFFFRHEIEGTLTKSLLVIVASLVGLAALLWLAEKVARHVREIHQVRWLDALVVGLAQACALIPGSSRSGTTITAGLFLGLKRESAARFSFLLSVPAVLASGLFELLGLIKMMQAGTDVFELGVANLVVSTVVAAISGYAAIAWLLRYLMRNTTLIFVVYRLLLGLALTTLLMLNIIQP
jgi:undecaprenyl-diphosphatase